MFTFKVEPWGLYCDVILSMMHRHSATVDEDHGIVKLDPDLSRFHSADNQGQLVLILGRDNVAGISAYVVVLTTPHWHYKSTKYGFVDAMWLDPEYRHATTGLAMVAFIEETMKALGVVKLVAASKVREDLNISAVYEFMGWRKAETIYEKVITV